MKSQPNRNYESNDIVYTPAPLARALVSTLAPSGHILEPCEGAGAFSRELEKYGTVSRLEAHRGEDQGHRGDNERRQRSD